MKKLLTRSSTSARWGLFALIIMSVLLFSFVWAWRVKADDGVGTTDQRLISVHDRGIEKGIITKAATLREALAQANISIGDNDLVEPGLDEQLVASSYQVNIYRARPVVVVDGVSSYKILTPHQTSKQIAQDAGLTLNDEDTTSVEPIADIASYGAGLQVTIDRATPFTLVLYGKTIQAYTQEPTVGSMLSDKNIKLASSDSLSVGKSTSLTSGMRVEVWRNGKQTLNEEQEITFPVEKIQDADRDISYHEVKTAGEKGKKSVTYEVVMKNGVEESRREIQSVVTVEPKKQVEVIGTKVNLPAGSHEDWMQAAGIAASDYGYVNYIVNREGGWEPCKVQGGAIDCNYSGSMGYGMVQATPGGKMVSAGADWRTNPITQLRWATSYAVGRYGSWQAAYNHWLSAHNW